MYVDSKSANLLSSEDIVGRIKARPVFGLGMRSHILAICTRVALFFAILAFCAVCGYEYAASLFGDKDSLPSGAVGAFIVIIAMAEMTTADYLPSYKGEEPSVSYSYFVAWGFATAFFLLLHESQVAAFGLPAVQVAAAFALATVIHGFAIIYRHRYLFGAGGGGINEEEL